VILGKCLGDKVVYLNIIEPEQSIRYTAAVGNVEWPQLMSRGYNRKLSAGSIAAGGTLGILAPQHRNDRLRHIH
jgi:hypothetical protein